jgi:hypothetical protein
MKKKSMFGILLLVVLSGGCNNSYTVKTKINPDGSFEKTIICDGDSLGIDKLPLPFVFKDGWKIDRQKKADRTANFITTATKKYPSADDLQAELIKGSDSSKLKIISHVEKHFRWFFTYYTYQETIPAFGLFKQAVRLDREFTPAEIERLKDGKDSLLNKRFEKYWDRNIVEELIDRLITASQKLNDPALAPSRWQEKRKFIAESILDNDKEMSKTGALVSLIGKSFHTPSAQKLSAAIDTSMNKIMEKVVFENGLDAAYKNEVVMPGMLISSNSGKVEGSALMWDCRPHRAIDVVMTAESRMINLWAIIATAVVCILILAGLLLPMIRVKNSHS